MFLHISTDHLLCFIQWTKHTLDFQDVERTFAPWLLKLIDTYMPKNIYVLNGPWSFTLLRVCCLAINLIAQERPLQIFTCTKPDLCSWLYETYDTFPEKIALTIGQKKQCRLYTCATKKEQKISFLEWQTYADVYIDPLRDCSVLGGEQYFSRVLSMTQDADHRIFFHTPTHSWEIDLHAACRQWVALLTSHYLIDPTMG